MRDRLRAETTAALKAQDKARLSALRLISAEIQSRDIASKTDIPDQDIPAVLQKMIKQRRESLAIYEKAGRTERQAVFLNEKRQHRPEKRRIDVVDEVAGRHRRDGDGVELLRLATLAFHIG